MVRDAQLGAHVGYDLAHVQIGLAHLGDGWTTFQPSLVHGGLDVVSQSTMTMAKHRNRQAPLLHSSLPWLTRLLAEGLCPHDDSLHGHKDLQAVAMRTCVNTHVAERWPAGSVPGSMEQTGCTVQLAQIALQGHLAWNV